MLAMALLCTLALALAAVYFFSQANSQQQRATANARQAVRVRATADVNAAAAAGSAAEAEKQKTIAEVKASRSHPGANRGASRVLKKHAALKRQQRLLRGVRVEMSLHLLPRVELAELPLIPRLGCCSRSEAVELTWRQDDYVTANADMALRTAVITAETLGCRMILPASGTRTTL